MIHPNVWFGHGPRQVRAWLAGALHRGLALVPPTSDWMGALIAADVVICDQGSVGVYAAAAGVPVILAKYPADDCAPGSAGALLAASAPRLRADRPLARAARPREAGYQLAVSDAVAARITSEPGRFDRNMRRLMYRLLRLRQPATIPAALPARAPVSTGIPDWR